jgi:hypothetical protein
MISMSRQVTLIIVAILLLLSIIAFVWMGCSVRGLVHEGFEANELRPKERELFEDLKNDKISKEEMTKLVKSGILNEELINKFLKNLDSTAAELQEEDKRVKEETRG